MVILLIIILIPFVIFGLAWAFIGLVALMDLIELGVKKCVNLLS